jgi:uncharacterized protein (TIGR03083 family)
MPSSLPYDPVTQLTADSAGLLAAAERAGLHTGVEACPGWTVEDLLAHVEEVWAFWAIVVEGPLTDIAQIRAQPRPARPAASELPAAARAAADRLLAALESTDPTTEVWTWTGANQEAAWVGRRQVQEAAVHRWDAEHASGSGWAIPGDVASDGIDEFLTWFLDDLPGSREPVGGTVHLHCTDVAGEWLVTPKEDGMFDVVREHAKGDAAVRGAANDLLLWLWRRPGGPVEVLGDAGVAARFQAATTLD